MQFILDNMLAAVIAATLFLMLVVLSVRGMNTTINATNSYALKKQELNFVEVLKQDLHGVKKVLTPIEDPADSTFRFRAKINTDINDTSTVVVEYHRIFVEMRDTVALYQIQRSEDGQAGGASMLTVTDWKIEALNADGNPVTSSTLDKAEQIHIRFEAAAPWKEDDVVRRSRWEVTFHPPLLRNGVLL
ncbi:MAG TPA: hypothetical protein VFG50_16000 [Rhodothermales bacterium]|nr:hypothetical protein [Rhodothermales bacterium]